MADNPKADPPDIADIQKTFERQISELRKEVAKINKSISSRGAELLGDAQDAAAEVYDHASERTSRAARRLRTEAHSVSEIARENPRATTAVLAMATFVGFMIGLAVAKASSEASRRWY